MNDKLNMSGVSSDEGSFVRNLEGRTGTGFQEGSHVHKDWWAKTISYESGMEAIESGVGERDDILCERQHMQPSISESGRFCFEYIDGREFFPTEHAIKQMATASNTSTFYMRSLLNNPLDSKNEERFGRDRQDAETLVVASRNALRRVPKDKKFRFRTYTDGTLRAWLTESYAEVDNRWYMEALQDIIPNGRLSHWKGDADTIFGNILVPESIIDYGQDDDSDYGAMVSIGNCEIGTRRISQYPSLFRSICMNGCIWGQVKGTSVSRVHRGKIDLNELKFQIGNNIETQLSLIPAGLERFMATRSMKIVGKMKNVIATICKDNKLSKVESSEVLTQWVTNEREHENLFGVVNAVTRAGQNFSNSSWVKFDSLGGKLLDMGDNKWSNILSRAGSTEDKSVNAVFSGSV